MHTHPKARLTALGRERLVRRHIDEHIPLAELACQAGISLRTAYQVARQVPNRRFSGTDGSTERSLHPAADARSTATAAGNGTPPPTLHHASYRPSPGYAGVRHWVLAQVDGSGTAQESAAEEPVHRYQWAQPGDMIHVDTKQLARFERVGHRINGDRRLGSSAGASYEKAQVAIDDATKVAYVEVLSDEQKATTVGFLVRAVAWFGSQGITCRRVLSDHGSVYRSKQWRKACGAMGLKAKRTRAYRPQTNRKSERFIKTLQNVWAYGMPFACSDERKQSLPRYLSIYNGRRFHMALAGRTPLQQLQLQRLRVTE